MDSARDYLKKLQDDLIEQFKGKPNIEVFQKALARQLEELYGFYYQLNDMRWLQNAEGAQLDGIGNIVDLSRMAALVWSNMAGQIMPMEDDLYRKFLRFKVFLNTSEGTYREIVRTFQMFWADTLILYEERPDVPATMFWTLEGVDPFATDNRVLDIAARVKAAGVALRFAFRGYEYERADWFAGAAAEFTRTFFTGDNVFIVTFETNYSAGSAAETKREFFAEDGDPILTGASAYDAAAESSYIRERYMEFAPIPDTAALYGGGIEQEWIKETHTE